ncbi:MAG: hypothetical protein AB4042_02330 [Leptolyngbyaceae cyanobacterium]
MAILNLQQSYTFSQIGKLAVPADELLAEYGYSFCRQRIDRPQFQGRLDHLEATCDRINQTLPLVDLTNETSRRETLIAPLVTDVAIHCGVQLRIEYAIAVNPWLQGILDYLLLQPQGPLLVVEAKQEDLTKGFNQLAVELIALDQWEKSPDIEQQSQIVGAVTTGDIWRFGWLDRSQKNITQGLALYRVPEDMEAVERILMGAIAGGS